MKTKIIFKIKNATEREMKMLKDALQEGKEIILSDKVTILIKNKNGYWKEVE